MRYSKFTEIVSLRAYGAMADSVPPLKRLCHMETFEEDIERLVSLARSLGSMEKAYGLYRKGLDTEERKSGLEDKILKEIGAEDFFGETFRNTLEVLESMGYGGPFTRAWLNRAYMDMEKDFLFERWLYAPFCPYVWLGDGVKDDFPEFPFGTFKEKAREMGLTMPRRTPWKATNKGENISVDRFIREVRERNRAKAKCVLEQYRSLAPSGEEWEAEEKVEVETEEGHENEYLVSYYGRRVYMTEEQMEEYHLYLYEALFKYGMLAYDKEGKFYRVVEDEYTHENLEKLFPGEKQPHRLFCLLDDIRSKTGKPFKPDYARTIASN